MDDFKFKPLCRWTYTSDDGILNNKIGRAMDDAPLPKFTPTPSISSLNPYNFYEYYGYNQVPDYIDRKGYGQTIAIIVGYGNTNIQSDLNVFCQQFNLPQKNIEIYYPTGIPTVSDTSWAVETNLDVQYAYAMAISARIILVVGKDNSFANLNQCVAHSVSALGADIVSMSYGAEEGNYINAYGLNTVYENLSAYYLGASGDDGAQVLYPGSSPNVLSVGGTVLRGGSSQNFAVSPGPYSEIGWSGSGGGISFLNPPPDYQKGWSSFKGRSVPDVSYNAGSGAAVYYTDPNGSGSGWLSVGGTSAGTPQWAAILARRNASGFSTKYTQTINSVIYKNAKTNFKNLFYDIKQGSNPYKASYGYDLVSGLGSPKVYSFLPPPIPVTGTPTSTPTQSPSQSRTPSSTPTNTPTPSKTATNTPTRSLTPTNSFSPTQTRTPTKTSTPTKTPTTTPTSTFKLPPSQTPTTTPIASRRPIASQTPTPTPSITSSPTPSPSETNLNIPLPSLPPTGTPTPTPTPSQTPSQTGTPTRTPTKTQTQTQTQTGTPTRTQTRTQTGTPTPSNTPSVTPTLTPTQTGTPTVTPTQTRTSGLTPTPTASSTSTPTPSQTQTQTQTPSQTQSQTQTATGTPTLTPTTSKTGTPTQTQTNTGTPTQTPTKSGTPTNTPTTSKSPTQTPTTSSTGTPTQTRTPSSTVSSTVSRTPTQTITPSPTRTPPIPISLYYNLSSTDDQKLYDKVSNVIFNLSGNNIGNAKINSLTETYCLSGNQLSLEKTGLITEYIDTNLFGSENQTFTFWFRPIATSGAVLEEYGEVFIDKTVSNYWWSCGLINIINRELWFGAWDGTQPVGQKSPLNKILSTQKWYFISWVYEKPTLSGFINGEMVVSFNFDRIPSYKRVERALYKLFLSGGNYAWKSSGTNMSNKMNARLRDFRMVNRALTRDEILNIYQNDIFPSNLLENGTFNDCTPVTGAGGTFNSGWKKTNVDIHNFQIGYKNNNQTWGVPPNLKGVTYNNFVDLVGDAAFGRIDQTFTSTNRLPISASEYILGYNLGAAYTQGGASGSRTVNVDVTTTNSNNALNLVSLQTHNFVSLSSINATPDSIPTQYEQLNWSRYYMTFQPPTAYNTLNVGFSGWTGEYNWGPNLDNVSLYPLIYDQDAPTGADLIKTIWFFYFYAPTTSTYAFNLTPDPKITPYATDDNFGISFDNSTFESYGLGTSSYSKNLTQGLHKVIIQTNNTMPWGSSIAFRLGTGNNGSFYRLKNKAFPINKKLIDIPSFTDQNNPGLEPGVFGYIYQFENNLTLDINSKVDEPLGIFKPTNIINFDAGYPKETGTTWPKYACLDFDRRVNMMEQVSASNITFSMNTFALDYVWNKRDCIKVSGEDPTGGGPFWGDQNKVVTVTTNQNKNYSFEYEYGGQDWILRRDNITGAIVGVMYMYGGSKPNQNNAFTSSDLNYLYWGTDIKISWKYLLQPDHYYNFDKIIRVPSSSLTL